MIKFIVKVAIFVLVIKYFVAPYLKENWDDIEGKLPAPVQQVAADFQQHLDENPDGVVSILLGEKMAKLEDAKKNVSLLEKRMKEMQEAADKAANGG